MCKKYIGLTLVEAFAFKHALEKQVIVKGKRADSLPDGCEELSMLAKDIEHETELIVQLETLIKEFRKEKLSKED